MPHVVVSPHGAASAVSYQIVRFALIAFAASTTASVFVSAEPTHSQMHPFANAGDVWIIEVPPISAPVSNDELLMRVIVPVTEN